MWKHPSWPFDKSVRPKVFRQKTIINQAAVGESTLFIEMPMKSYQMTFDHCLFDRFNGQPNDIDQIARGVCVARVLAVDMRIHLNLFRWASLKPIPFNLVRLNIRLEHVMEMSLHWYAFKWKIFLWPTLNAITMTTFRRQCMLAKRPLNRAIAMAIDQRKRKLVT